MNILSLFDGMSCGQIALNRAGIKYDKYYASEIDKYAIQVTQKNYPDTIQLGDITKINGNDLPKIDLIMGGSPCQGLSVIGKRLNFDDHRSKLFFEFVRLLKECKPKWFLLENVKMKPEWIAIINEQLGVEPILINSALVSAQNRQRLYWTNIPFGKLPEDKGILLKDIIHERDGIFITKNHNELTPRPDGKSTCIDHNYHKGIDNHGQRTVLLFERYIRKLTPVECERLQTVPDDYTKGISNTQRYKMLGNGWTVDVIVHILKGIKSNTKPLRQGKLI